MNCAWNSLVFSYLVSYSEWRCLRCSFFYRLWKTEKHSCRSSVISMQSHPPQYPRSSTSLKTMSLPLSQACIKFSNWGLYQIFVISQANPSKSPFILFQFDNLRVRHGRTTKIDCIMDLLYFVQFDWCCFYYFLRNSLVALLEALFARSNQAFKLEFGCMSKHKIKH